MSKTISGYELKITAFLTTGSSAAHHAAAKANIEHISEMLGNLACVEIVVTDKWAPKHKVAESSDG